MKPVKFLAEGFEESEALLPHPARNDPAIANTSNDAIIFLFI